MGGQLRVDHDAAGHRYTLSAGAEVLSDITYSHSGDAIVFEHTTTSPVHRRKGHAERLTEAALADVRARGLRLVAVCPFTQTYLRRHPDQNDLLAESPDTASSDTASSHDEGAADDPSLAPGAVPR
jgi:uncharacterized protein